MAEGCGCSGSCSWLSMLCPIYCLCSLVVPCLWLRPAVRIVLLRAPAAWRRWEASAALRAELGAPSGSITACKYALVLQGAK